MASKTQRTEMQRKRKTKAQNRKRKNKLAKNGSTKSAKVLFGD
ncbi:MAG: hypothetical protein BroJett040_10480 [Oligoflexia bacterium]|nr:MAG: hypothetical protein BroJett040_10480 [Oligoflexia bacterium]